MGGKKPRGRGVLASLLRMTGGQGEEKEPSSDWLETPSNETSPPEDVSQPYGDPGSMGEPTEPVAPGL